MLSLSIAGFQQLELSMGVSRPEPLISGALLHDAFEARVVEAPSSVAIDYLTNGQRTAVSYAELNNKSIALISDFVNNFEADALAATLEERYGITLGDIVPIFLYQTPDLLVTVIGILKAGAGYSPILRDGRWPLDRICQVLSRCQAKVLISYTSFLPSVREAILNVHYPLNHSSRPSASLATP
jgi:non-ribosomal peptide synthetase component F